jgi:hypothetical protein
MKISKTKSSKSEFKGDVEKEEKENVVEELVHPRIQAKLSNSFGAKKASNSLVVQMYSQENDVLFI